MLVHDRDAALLAGLLSGLARRRLPLVVLALVAWGLACLGAGIALERSGAWEEVVLPAALKNVRLPVHAVRGWLSDPEELVLDLDHEAYQRLAFQREQALAAGVLSAGEDDFVPAAIRIGEGRVRAAVRLKGDRLDHLEGSKWSLRVRVKGGETVLGMRQFSLQHPGLRSYADEWLFHRALAREDVLGLRYRFVSVILNGRRLGVYALEEHLDRTLVEHQRRREGVIVRFDETLNWVHLSTDGADSFARAAVDPFHGEEVAAREELAAQFRTAHTLLEGYRQGRLSASQVFDVERLARFYALTDLLGAGHAARWANQRFYYNPVTARLEPIGFDGNAGRETRALVGDYEGPEVVPAEGDPAYRAAYLAALERMSRPDYLARLLEEEGPALRSALDVLYREFPWYRFDTTNYERNRIRMERWLSPPLAAHAYRPAVAPGTEARAVQVGNLLHFPLEVLEAVDAEGGVLVPEGGRPVLLPSRLYRGGPPYRELSFRPAAAGGPVRLRCRMAGGRRVHEVPVAPWALPDENGTEALLAAPPWAGSDLEDFPFVLPDEPAGRVLVRPGRHRLDRDLVLPPGVALECGPGTELDLTAGAAILCRGPVRLRGAADSPVRFTTSDGTGQGLAVLAAGAPSELAHVHFEGLSAPTRPDWRLTGAVTFYESEARLADCLFEAGRAEDALNVVRSEFTLARTTFRGTAGDAFDGDFVRGSIDDCVFEGVGNDAMDLSGSEVVVSGCRVEGAGDKGVSAGEGSRVGVRALSVTRSDIGVASKDDSEVEVHGLHLADCRYAFALYRKKAEFGPARLVAEGVSQERIREGDLVEEGSTLLRDLAPVAATARHVWRLLERP